MELGLNRICVVANSILYPFCGTSGPPPFNMNTAHLHAPLSTHYCWPFELLWNISCFLILFALLTWIIAIASCVSHDIIAVTASKSKWLSATNIDYLLTWQWVGEGALIYNTWSSGTQDSSFFLCGMKFSTGFSAYGREYGQYMSFLAWLGCSYITSDCFLLAESQSHDLI